MSLDIAFRKQRLGSFADEGQIIVSADHIAATESTNGTGDQMTTITLAGGREVHVRGSHDQVRKAIAKARAERCEPQEFVSLFEQIFGRKS